MLITLLKFVEFQSHLQGIIKATVFDVETGVSTQSIFGDLISFGVDMNTIQLYPRIIDVRLLGT
jgi:hypothetical protein